MDHFSISQSDSSLHQTPSSNGKIMKTDITTNATNTSSTQYAFVSRLTSRRVNRFSSKSKHGCETCKKRRIKCDQGKPTCLNCNRSSRICEGYQTLSINFDKNSEISGTDRSSIPSQLHKYDDGVEAYWLDVFVAKTAVLISKFSMPYFWMTLVPQVSWQNEGVRHALVALAMACEEHDNMHLNPTTSGLERVKSVYHYNEAIRAVTVKKQTKEIVMLLCVLFWTYENLKDRPFNATTHLKAAVAMLDEDRRKDTYDEDIVTEYIEPCLQECMANVAMALLADGKAQPTEPTEAEFQKALDDFTPAKHPKDIQASRSDLERCRRLLVTCKQMTWKLTGSEPTFNSIRKLLHDWKEIVDEHKHNWSENDVQLLLTHYLVTIIDIEITEADGRKTLLNYDALRPQFEQLLSETRYLASDNLRRHKTIEMSLIMPLSFIGRKHPDNDIAAKAIATLEEYEFFEGVWNFRVVASMVAMVRLADADRAVHDGDLAAVFEKTRELRAAGKERLSRPCLLESMQGLTGTQVVGVRP